MTRDDEMLRRFEAVQKLNALVPSLEQPQPPETAAAAPFTCEFGGLEFRVEPGVFAPNPACAPIIDVLIEATRGLEHPVVVDVGTGAGAFAISYGLRRPEAHVFALDNSEVSVACARANAVRLRCTNVRFVCGSLLEPMSGSILRFDAVVANLPYVPAVVEAVINTSESFWRGPRETVVGGGRDGLALVRALVRQADPLLAHRGLMALAMNDWQAEAFVAAFGQRYRAEHLPGPGFVTLRPAAGSRPDL
jgi:release factor glutamine methyltransferase